MGPKKDNDIWMLPCLILVRIGTTPSAAQAVILREKVKVEREFVLFFFKGGSRKMLVTFDPNPGLHYRSPFTIEWIYVR